MHDPPSYTPLMDRGNAMVWVIEFALADPGGWRFFHSNLSAIIRVTRLPPVRSLFRCQNVTIVLSCRLLPTKNHPWSCVLLWRFHSPVPLKHMKRTPSPALNVALG